MSEGWASALKAIDSFCSCSSLALSPLVWWNRGIIMKQISSTLRVTTIYFTFLLNSIIFVFTLSTLCRWVFSNFALISLIIFFSTFSFSSSNRMALCKQLTRVKQQERKESPCPCTWFVTKLLTDGSWASFTIFPTISLVFKVLNQKLKPKYFYLWFSPSQIFKIFFEYFCWV